MPAHPRSAFAVLPHLCLLLGLAAAAISGEAGKGTVVLTLEGSLAVRPSQPLLGDGDLCLHDATMRLREALAAPEPRIVLDCSRGFEPSLAAAEELAAVLRDRSPGKQVVCIVDRIRDSAMVVAGACDEVVMPEGGALMVHGIAMDHWYLAPALAKIGVRFRAVASGPFKTAPESFTREGPTDEAKAEMRQLLGSLDKVLVGLSVHPGFDAARLAKAREAALQCAAAARDLGLVGSLADPAGYIAAQPPPIRRLRSGKDAPDLSSLAGLMRFLGEVMGGDSGARPERSVAVVEMAGMIIPGDGSMPGETICDGDTVAMLDRLRDDRRVVAVVLRIDSGGGDAGASDRIHAAVRRLDAVKPVVCLMDSVAASGGYWIASAAREIRVHRATITGSIGAFAMVPDLDEGIAMLGLRRHVEVTSPQADIFHPGNWSPQKEAVFKAMIADVDRRFRKLVSDRRKLAPERVDQLAEGRVFTGDEAVANGLADGLGTLPSAVARARELAGEPAPLPLERFPKSGGLAARLGLASTLAVVPGAARIAVLAELARRGPVVLAWDEIGSVR